MSVQDIQKQLKEQGIDTIEAGFSDFQGALRGKRFPLRQLPELLHNGFATCRAALAWDIQCGIFPIPLASFENGYPDLVARPILETLRPVPWRPGSAFVLSDIFDTEGNPLPESPREVLKKTLTHAKTLGYRPLVGAELEFYLLNENNQPVFSEIQAYSLSLGASLEYVIRDIRNHLEAFGIEVEASNTEYGPAQIEINLTYGDALQVADQTILFKNAVKEIARQHGLRATFMAKPWEDQSGSGLHLHQSLWDLERSRNLFAENPEIASQYLAGLLV
ncbi:MAG: glutamine synthetase family protein, partial [Fibrobacteraceae bacterium]